MHTAVIHAVGYIMAGRAARYVYISGHPPPPPPPSFPRRPRARQINHKIYNCAPARVSRKKSQRGTEWLDEGTLRANARENWREKRESHRVPMSFPIFNRVVEMERLRFIIKKEKALILFRSSKFLTSDSRRCINNLQ